MDFTIENGKYYKVLDKDSGDILAHGELEDGSILSTILTVVFISHADFLELNNLDNAGI